MPSTVHHTSAQRDTGTWRRGQLLQPASATRRWWARIVDALFILFATLTIAVTAMLLQTANVISLDAATAVALLGYPVVLLTLGALYGCTCSPGQALLGVVSLQTDHGRRVGFWRGMGRYLGVGVFPLGLIVFITLLFDAPFTSPSPIRVYRRAH